MQNNRFNTLLRYLDFRIVLALGILLTIPTQDSQAQFSRLDSVDVQIVGKEILGTRDGRSASRVRLENSEYVHWIGARGALGLALTNRRILAISTTSSGWLETRLLRLDGQVGIEGGREVALIITNRRLLFFRAAAGTFIEIFLGPGEELLSSSAGDEVAVAVSNRRAIGISAKFERPSELKLHVQEEFLSLKVLDTAANLRTSKRLLSFHGSLGGWKEEVLPIH